MAPSSKAVTMTVASGTISKLDTKQTLKASTALLRKIQTDEASSKETSKANLLEDADGDEPEDETPVWMVLTTKKHIADKKRLKPGKIVLPHPYLDAEQENLKICLITADPQRKYKDLISEPGFPLELGKRIGRVIGMEKLKSKYKSYESKRQLLGEYDVFLADDRVITYLPTVLGKTFYKSGTKRPIPITLEGKRQTVDEQGNKRRRLAEGGSKVTKDEVKPKDAAHEITRTLGCTLVHLAPSTTTAVKVGIASQTPEQIQANVEAVMDAMVERYVPQKWKNIRAVHIKGPDTAALPIYLTDELWADEQDVLEEAPKANVGKKRKRGALTEASENEVLEVPGPDGKMRTLEKPASKKKSLELDVAPKKKRKSEEVDEEAEAKVAEKAEKKARKEALKAQKDSLREDVATESPKSKRKATADPPAPAKKAGKKAKTKA
ncbi:Putative ribosome biogenesis protein [Fulvia fulva]|uniref:Ribosome biogenesis protein n=1 Tax=Passalora fulva TaxID=5499 RepID=A0A9Q8LBD5_PASFU|nr:Putative ribosome biogenesis protein [Fulvia fulva]KAK4631950.1 putative ribosome biogenesis protein [Fulvia fulva]KAK4633036.1 putative ribosome biogenesis protein [Fulvia fulva]UJO14284.1 Putative ribosome biogenesis protein [Fulvia fulva]WPV11445.1 Putative ribosome biogenesis protein [Fulvia fulva]WPV26016.1 Putative ribosome biogenesis protein [Fulvia fulva]